MDSNLFKLQANLKPGFFHGYTVRKNVQYIWNKKVRPFVLEQADYTCSICGYKEEKPKKHTYINVHEVEEYRGNICVLKGLELLCADCHNWQHIGRSFSVFNHEQRERMIKHFCEINECTTSDCHNYVQDFFLKRRESFLKQSEKLHESLEVKFLLEGDIPFKQDIIEKLKEKGLYV